MRVQHMVPAGGLGTAQAPGTQSPPVAVVTVYATPREGEEEGGDAYGGVTQA